ncbi:peroxiredoxin Q/BCP [Paenibacillus sp. UNCCL117]|uniref:thioredoxin-dependent thiol peroxidase n=1 Tax=unclassified Paenibacillus TaxID=185978 RepID=UPI0008835CA5|nr:MULTISPECIES: thioredoxin-dependent thiol peroxidase [unclassified Paenibacillus]SDD89672.1 peroxiredoxin Q/BCP [Paenibacillus sp. cl123]SFW44104.1 peroxiredoxin Q/BCP [Paenibacillus sp. UNCCL117]
MQALTIGQSVPDFTLPASSGEDVSLSQFRGRHIVLYFYPKNMTPACTEEACQFRDYSGQFSRLNTSVIGISPDPVRSHQRFAAKYELPFPLLSDPEHEVAELFGVWALKKLYGREYMGIVRSTFLIDKEGRLAKEWRGIRVKGHLEQVLQAVKELES